VERRRAIQPKFPAAEECCATLTGREAGALRARFTASIQWHYNRVREFISGQTFSRAFVRRRGSKLPQPGDARIEGSY